MRLRHVAARFLSVGAGRRPMFETMGFQDGSTGLYEAGLSVRGLDWADDAAFAAGYAAIERFYAGLRPFLASASIVDRFADGGLAWWQIRAGGSSRLVVVALSLETAEGAAPGRIAVPSPRARISVLGREASVRKAPARIESSAPNVPTVRIAPTRPSARSVPSIRIGPNARSGPPAQAAPIVPTGNLPASTGRSPARQARSAPRASRRARLRLGSARTIGPRTSGANPVPAAGIIPPSLLSSNNFR